MPQNRMRGSARSLQSGQTIYQTMLIVACVALLLAVFFPVYEYFELYHGPVKSSKFPSSGAPIAAPVARPRAPAAEAPAPAPEAAPAAEPSTEAAPAAQPAAPAGQ